MTYYNPFHQFKGDEMDNEIWKAIPGYEGRYEASDMGQIRSVDRIGGLGKGVGLRTGRILKISTTGIYKCVGLSNGTSFKQFSVHRLVMMTFVGERPVGLDICHGDGDPSNNKLSNLRYDTKKGNAADKVAHRTNNAGDTNPRATLTAEEVMGIYQRCSNGEQQLKVAEELGVNTATVNHICSGRTWRSVTGVLWSRKHKVITPKIVRQIDELQASGLTLDQIALSLGISKPSAFRHSKGKSTVRMEECL